MKFTVEVSNETLARIKEFHEQALGIYSENPAEVIKQLFFLADQGSGWLDDLTEEVEVFQED